MAAQTVVILSSKSSNVLGTLRKDNTSVTEVVGCYKFAKHNTLEAVGNCLVSPGLIV